MIQQTRVCMNVLKCIWRQVPLGKVNFHNLNQQQIYHGRYPKLHIPFAKKKDIHCQVGFQGLEVKDKSVCVFWSDLVRCWLMMEIAHINLQIKTVIVMLVYSEFAHHSWCIINILGRMVSYDIYLSYPISQPHHMSNATRKNTKNSKNTQGGETNSWPRFDEHPFWGKQPIFRSFCC